MICTNQSTSSWVVLESQSFLRSATSSSWITARCNVLGFQLLSSDLVSSEVVQLAGWSETMDFRAAKSQKEAVVTTGS